MVGDDAHMRTYTRLVSLRHGRQRGFWLVRPCGAEDFTCARMAACTFYHPLAHGVVQVLWMKWCGRLSLVVERSVRGAN